MNRGEPVRAFKCTSHYLVSVAPCIPSRESILRRILVRSPKFTSLHLHLGPWNGANRMYSQYKWRDGTAILNSSTTQLQTL